MSKTKRCRICRKNLERKVYPEKGKSYYSIGHRYKHPVMKEIIVCTSCFRVLSKQPEYEDPKANQKTCILCNITFTDINQYRDVWYMDQFFFLCMDCYHTSLDSPKALQAKINEDTEYSQSSNTKARKLATKATIEEITKERIQEKLESISTHKEFNPFDMFKKE